MSGNSNGGTTMMTAKVMTKLTDAGNVEWFQVSGYATDSPHLVVTPVARAVVYDDDEVQLELDPDRWLISHGPTGHAIGPSMPDPDAVIGLANRLAEIADWSDPDPLGNWPEHLQECVRMELDDFRERHGLETRWR